MIYADIIIDISSDKLDRSFQYKVPERLEQEIKVGMVVSIPFGNASQLRKGYVTGFSKEPKIASGKLKEICEICSGEETTESRLIALAAWMKENYGSTMIQALKTVLPIQEKIKAKERRYICLNISEDEGYQILADLEKTRFRARTRLLKELLEKKRLDSAQASKKLGATSAVIKKMQEQGIIRIEYDEILRNSMDTSDIPAENQMLLTQEQEIAVQQIREEWEKQSPRPVLIEGVTGSGKTQVYMKLIEWTISRGEQAIVLIPEIALTYQTVVRFQKRFGDRVTVLNSRMSEGEKYDQYERAKQGEVDIVVGPRSALFIPFSNLGLILIDEEHEMSYKSEKPPKYHARDVAIERARQSGASVVLGSATPSVESYEKAKTGEYTLLTLPHRVNHVSMPKVYVADLRKELEEGNRSIFSRVLQEKIEERLKRGEQTILFLNRRGYAGFVSCRSCGFVLKCSHCEVSMTAHKNHVGDVDTLVCHYCGHAIAMPKTCPSCGSPYIAAFGLGTQKVEEMLNKRFPTARVLRMDGDTTTGKHGHESVLTPFRNGEADILIGTQMIVKGHDFPNVTLVAALAADMSLYAGDYRSSERTFELLMQASGRAGRAEKAGEVVIQTYNPEEYSIQAVAGQDAEYFYENELAFRRLMKYPPYSQMAAILILSEEENEAKTLSEKLAENIHFVCGDAVTLIGPSKAGLSRAKDRYRYVLYVKSMDEEAMDCVREIAEEANRRVVNQKTCSVQYDRDPVNGY